MRRTHLSLLARVGPLALLLTPLVGACAGSQKEVAATAGRPKPTLAAALAACSQIQEQESIAVGCITRDIAGVPSMFIAFDRQTTADRHLSRMATDVAAPFCEAANRSHRPASVYIAIDARAKRYNCELGQWSEWFSFNGNLASLEPDPNLRSASPEAAVADAVARCRRVHENSTIPVACKLQVINEIPSMVIGFRNEQEASEFLRPMAENVAGPFCDAANDSGQQAAVAVVVAKRTARLFDCEHGRWGEWFKLGNGGDDEAGASAAIAL
jgi:hypothetical protein